MDAGFAQALHAQEVGLQPRRLMRVRAADVRAAVEVDDGRDLPGPLLGQGLDGPLGHAALVRGPFRGLGDAVLAAEHVVLELLEAHHVGGHVVLVVRALDHPGVGDGQVQRRVGVGEDGDPLVGVDRAGVVEVGRDEDLLLAQLAPVVEDVGGELAGEAPGRRLEIGTDVDEHVRVLGHVVHHVVGRQAKPVLAVAPDVLGAPVPALPAVGVAHHLGEAAGEREQVHHDPVDAVHRLGLAVAVTVGADRQRARTSC